MFLNKHNSSLASFNFYRLLDSKMNGSKFLFDFYPVNQIDFNEDKKNLKKLKRLNTIFLRNFRSKLPFNLFFTNYKRSHDQHFKKFVDEKRKLPNFIDFLDCLDDKSIDNDKKLIIILKQSGREIFYDSQANYILPLFMNDRKIDSDAQKYYINKFINRQNCEFVHVDTDLVKALTGEHQLTYDFYFYLLDSLKNNLDYKDAIQKAFYFIKRSEYLK